MSFPYINAYQQFFDSSGDPLVSGTIEFRDPTSNSLINSYPTADDADAQTNANANPLTLSATGAASAGLFLEDGVAYKVILKDAAGNTVATHDDVRCPIALPYLQTSAESAAGVTPTNLEYPPGNVLRYGTNTTPGTTDMTAALTNAINSNPGDVYIPAGTYSIDGAAMALSSFTSGLSIRGDGPGVSILKDLDIRLTTANDLTISGLSFTEHNFCFLLTDVDRINVRNCEFSSDDAGTGRRAFQFFRCDEILIDGNTFRDGQYSLHFQDSTTGHSKYIRITNNFFDNSGYQQNDYPAGVNIESASHVTITGNTFKDFLKTTTDEAYGIYQGDNSALATNTSAYDITISGNTFFNCETASVRLHNMSIAGIIGNTCDHDIAIGNFIQLDGDADPGTVPYPDATQSQITISGNTSKGGRIVVGDATYDVSITGNNIQNTPSQGINIDGTGAAISHHVLIDGNIIRNVDQDGIRIELADQVVVTNNIIIDANMDDAGAGNTDACNCIRYASSTNTLTTGNKFYNTSGSAGAHYGINYNTNAARHVYDRTNQFEGMRTGRIRGAYAAAPTAGDWNDSDFVPSMTLAVNGDNMIPTGWMCTADGTPGTWSALYISTVTPAT